MGRGFGPGPHLSKSMNQERKANMKYIALFATDHPAPDHQYAGIPVAGSVVYVRAVDVTDQTEGGLGEALDVADGVAEDGETVLNTVEIE